MTERTCGNCRWWKAFADADKIQGNCVRNAPLRSFNLDTEPYPDWPLVHRGDFCGEWADAATTPEQDERRELVRRFAVAIAGTEYGGDIAIDSIWGFASKITAAEPDLVTKQIS